MDLQSQPPPAPKIEQKVYCSVKGSGSYIDLNSDLASGWVLMPGYPQMQVVGSAMYVLAAIQRVKPSPDETPETA